MKKTVLGLLLCLLVNTTLAQENLEIIKPTVFGIGKPKGKKILLKWGVNLPVTWKNSLKNGYKLERRTVLRDDKPLEKQETVVLKEVIKPLSLIEMEPLVAKDSLVAVLAQAIYGEDFETTKKEKGVFGMILTSEENERRYGFALMAAEQSYIATKAAGWGYEDETAVENEKYVYVISLLGEKEPVNPATIYVGLRDKIDTTPPLKPEVIFADKNATIAWDSKSQKSLFSCYFLEKSTDGINFTSMTQAPIFPVESKTDYITYSDSKIANEQNTFYRIVGMDSFGDRSEPSIAVNGKGVELLEESPEIIYKNAVNDDTAVIEWRFPVESEKRITGFSIQQANAIDGEFKEVRKDILPNIRKTTFKVTLKPSNYFKVVANAKNGISKLSGAVLVQPVDSIPPTKPINLSGIVDSLGIVKMKWKKNTEPDLYGYKVFKGNNKTEEFSEATTFVIKNNQFLDTIVAKNLNKKIYYKVKALDFRYNESGFSEILELKKIDKIAPSSPFFIDYAVDNKKVTLTYELSAADDVTKYIIYRRTTKEKNWIKVFETKDLKNKSFTDTNVVQNERYYYVISATDDEKNESEFLDPFLVELIPNLVAGTINTFFSTVVREAKAIELIWNTTLKNVVHFELYRSKEKEKTNLYKVLLPSNKNFFVDDFLKPGNTYNYSIRALLSDGTYTKFKELSVIY